MKSPYRRGSFFTRFFTQFTFYILIPLVILVMVIALGGISLHQQAMRNLASQQDLRMLRSAASSLAEQVNDRLTTLQSLGSQITAGGDPKQVFINQNDLGDLFDGGVALYDRKITLVAASPDYGLNQLDPNDIQLVLATLPDQAQTPIDLAPSPINRPNQSPLLLMVGRLTPSLEIVGAYSLDSLARTAISPTFSPADSAVYLVDSAGHILYQNVPAGTKVSPIPGLSEIAASQGGVNDPSLDNSLSINYTPVPGLSWILAAQDLGQSLSDPYLNTPLNAPLALIPIGLFALIALVFGITQVTGPLKKLERQVTQSAWRSNGKLPDSVGGITEIRDLGAIMLAVDEHHQRKVTDLEGFIQATTGLPADQRLGAALQNRVQQVQKASDIQVTIEISGKPHNLPVEQEISLYKVACEALENILQHSQARQGWVHLQYGDGEVWLEVRDDGQGFVLPKSPSTLTRTGKFGLASMADQAAESGARLEIDTTPGHGTSIRMAIPNALPRSENSLQKSA